MYRKIKQAIRGRTGPVGLSLVAAAVTAVAFAGISMAANGGGSDKQDQAGNGRPGGPPMSQMRLSEENREALEEFRQCMADEGVELPEPPDPSSGEQGERPAPPEPPSEAERAEMEKALEACEDKLPEGARGIGPHPCGPPPGAGGEGSNVPGTTIPGPPQGSGSQQDGTAAPQGATS